MIDLKSHLTVVDNQGNKTSVILPYADYEQIISLLNKYDYLSEFEASLSKSIDQLNAIKSGDIKSNSLQSLIDEL